LLLVVDQFEELFTIARLRVEPFQQALLRLAGVPNCYVVLTVRADFYPDLMAAPLWREIQAHRVEVLPLDEDGLRQAIVRPAEDVGVFVETALVERLVADAGREPGVLPLLQETLVLLWEWLERRFLPLSAYEALGSAGRTGVQVAMARRADAALADLTPQQQPIARRIFLRLVQFGEGRADTRRQQTVVALRTAGDEPDLFDQTLRHLTNNRLLTLGGEAGGDGRQVDIAHEALITGWPTLQEWLAERREAEQTRRRLEDKAAEWERLGRGSGGLLDEVELLEAERWLTSPDAAILGTGEALPALVQASRTAIRAAEREKEATRQRELAQAQALAEEQRQRAEEQTRAGRRLRRLAIGLAVVFLIALGAAVVAGVAAWYAGEQQQEAVAAQGTAVAEANARATEVVVRSTAEAEAVAAQETAEEERDRADLQARLATSRQLAAQSQAVLEEFPQRSLLLYVEALNITSLVDEPRVPAAEQALRQALANSGGRVLSGHEHFIQAVAISPDNHWLATGSYDGTARLWDLTAEDPAAAPIVLRGHEGRITAVVISPDNRWLVTGSWDDTARLWDLTAADPAAAPIVLRGHEDWIRAVAISSDNHWLVTGSYDGTARLWDLTGPYPAAEPIVLRGHEDAIFAIAISPDNHWLITGGGDWISGHGDNAARLWNLRLDELVDLACRTAGRNLTHVEWAQYLPGQEYRQTCEQWPLEGE